MKSFHIYKILLIVTKMQAFLRGALEYEWANHLNTATCQTIASGENDWTQYRGAKYYFNNFPNYTKTNNSKSIHQVHMTPL